MVTESTELIASGSYAQGSAVENASLDGRPSIGSIIATLRTQSGLTQAAFAAALGVARSTVAQWETGHGGETRHISRIAEVLGTSIDVFLTGMISRELNELVSFDEAEILRLYRSLDVKGRLAALREVRSLTSRRMALSTDRRALLQRQRSERPSGSS